MKPTTPLPCPICGRKPKCVGYVLKCEWYGETVQHTIQAESNSNLYPVRQWNSYVRRIRARIAKENAK